MLKVLITDDEDLARLRLRGLVHDCLDPKAEVIAEAANATQALAWLADHTCDLVLLDVQMPGRDGLQLAAELRRGPNPPAIVFVTAHAHHAVQAFDLEAIDYLTKPVKRERLHAALQRVAQRLSLQHAPALPAEPATEVPVIVISDRGRVLRLPLAEVLYLKAELKYVTLRTALHTHVLDESLSELEARLGDRFLRVHRNALVARDAVRALERRVLTPPADAASTDEDSGEVWAVCMEPIGEWLAVSRRQVAAVREALLNR